MRKIFKKLSVATVMMTMSLGMVFSAFADETETATNDNEINIRISVEGVKDTLYSGEIKVNKDATVKDVIEKVDSESDKITVVSAATDTVGYYISGINDVYEYQYGGYSGWSYRIDGNEATEAMDKCTLKDRQSIIVYYGDPKGKGMQYPEILYKNGGEMQIVSQDKVYDENGNANMTKNPVKGATVTVNKKSYTTDDEGKIQIAKEDLSSAYTVKVEKYDEASGMPLVLRTSATIIGEVQETTTSETTKPETTVATSDSTTTQEDSTNYELIVFIVAMVIVVGGVALAILQPGEKNKKNGQNGRRK